MEQLETLEGVWKRPGKENPHAGSQAFPAVLTQIGCANQGYERTF